MCGGSGRVIRGSDSAETESQIAIGMGLAAQENKGQRTPTPLIRNHEAETRYVRDKENNERRGVRDGPDETKYTEDAFDSGLWKDFLFSSIKTKLCPFTL